MLHVSSFSGQIYNNFNQNTYTNIKLKSKNNKIIKRKTSKHSGARRQREKNTQLIENENLFINFANNMFSKH